ncbi:alpha/beta hydrolase [Hymenobacter latericus]|uniref:alpha/beta hydrolase n=1 Tax=Hymenobacter sp. YIM 151858-1 TaxID=2987688 RepID=UPI0022270AA3|nr:alpha/beta hydrolase [Hymenobacter sp. YIM 151858-1]UYZ57550.1 alpha/beta hydrolase [Hymenobacter sp. YIM 151858-1]
MTTILTIPGLGSPGPQHWQNQWEEHYHYQRVEQQEWDRPVCDDWVQTLEAAVAATGPRVVLVAHWARQTRLPLVGALLVAPADAERPDFPPEPQGFAPVPLQRLRAGVALFCQTRTAPNLKRQCGGLALLSLHHNQTHMSAFYFRRSLQLAGAAAMLLSACNQAPKTAAAETSTVTSSPAYQEANALFEKHAYAEALPKLYKLAQENPADAELHYKIGVAEANQKEYANSSASFRRALRHGYDKVAVMRNIGINYIWTQRLDSAKHYLRAAQTLAPNDAKTQKAFTILNNEEKQRWANKLDSVKASLPAKL